MQPQPTSLSEASQMILNIAAGDSVAVALRKVGSPEQIRSCLPGLEYLIEASQAAADIIRNLFSAGADSQASADGATVVAAQALGPSPLSAAAGVPPAPAVKADHLHSKLHEALDKLPHYREIKHVSADLASKYDVERVPRNGSRGNAILYVLQGPARLRPIAVSDLLHALRVMGVFDPDDDAARQKLSWEILELRKKGWPVERDLEKNLVSLRRGGPA